MTILDLIGNTPLIKIENIYAKFEALNPSGSIKDRAVLQMIEDAEKQGKIKKGYTIVEASSGNTGISLSMIGALKNYKVTVVMPENMSKERIQMMRAFGAKIFITPANENLKGAIKKAEELAKKPKTFLLNQFNNPSNIKAHEKTGREILEQIGKVDAVVAGMGTGGTLIGISNVLKKANPKLKIIAVMAKEEFEKHKIQGISDGFIPNLVNMKKIDKIFYVSSKQAINMTKKLAKKYGLMVGISSGANMLAAFRAGKNYKKVVTVLPDRGERYLSTGLYN